MGSNTLLWPGLLLDGGGWVGPTQSIGWSCFALISIAHAQGQSGDRNKLCFYHLSILSFEPWCALAGMPLACIPLLDLVAGGDKT